MIWDLHCHLSGVPGRTPDERMVQLIEYADRMGIDRLCVYMGMPWALDPSPEELRKENDQVIQAISHWHHRAFGFAYVSGKHVEASLQEIERLVVRGPMVGIKLWVAKECSAPELDPIIRRAAELKAVIFQHTWFKVQGNPAGESTPLDMVLLAQRHPNVPMICGHTGGDWEKGIRAIRPYKNVFADLAGSDPTAGYTEMAVRELGAERVIYGSDIGGRSLASQLSKILGADISVEAKQLIAGENLKRLMMPILKIKGVSV